jgi:F-type H+-transporting ATPase subunit a
MRLSADQLIFWQHGFFKLNGTIVFTWALMLVLAVGSKLITRKLSTELKRSRWQNLLEIVVTAIEKQIEDVGLKNPQKYIGFLGTLFLFVALAALCTVIPGYEPPTGSLSTTAALALCVFVAVPLFGIEEQGLWATSSLTRSRRSSCCHLISSANFRARWRWPSVCSAT